MARAPRPCSPKGLQTKEQQLAARAAAVAVIESQLLEGPKTIGELLAAVGGKRATLVSYLIHVHKTRRTARPTSERRGNGFLWVLGADLTLPTQDEELDRMFAVKRGSGPARQIGMIRDPLVAALFGPAVPALGAAA